MYGESVSLSTGYWVLRAAHRLSRYALGIGNSISVLAAPGDRERERERELFILLIACSSSGWPVEGCDISDHVT